jgi:hypothetical protein
MKFYVKKLFGIFLNVLLLISHIYFVNSLKSLHKIKNTFQIPSSTLKNFNPLDIVQINSLTENDKRVEIDLNENDPLEYMKRKEELINLYLRGKDRLKEKSLELGGRLRFKQKNSLNSEFGITNPTFSDDSSSVLVTKPTSIGKSGDPTNKEYRNEEEVVKVISASAESYMDPRTNEKFMANLILSDSGKFWCSEGNHDLTTPVKFYAELEKSHRLSAFWIHWAFAPGQYRVLISNKKENDNSINWSVLIDWKDSIKGGDSNWWKSVITNPKTRWKYKSFDERVNLEEPTWARYILIEMRLPVNQYYGIYKLEFYIKSKAVVILKSRRPGEESCLSVANGLIANNSPVIMIDCLQGITYGDNRDLFVLHSNGLITTFRGGKCLQSPSSSRVDILECGKSQDFKDDREKWILEYDGKIRSMKEEFTCLTITDFSVKDEIPVEDLKITASSIQNDGIHGPEKTISDDLDVYWASNPTLSEVKFEIFMTKHPYVVKDMTIDWKFPAKSFQVVGLYPDGYWRIFKNTKNNRETTTYINFMNKDLLGIRITMTSSSSVIEEKFVYGIKNISLHTGGRYLRRDPCKNILLESNKFEIIDVSVLDEVTGNEFKKSKAQLHRTRTKLRLVESLFTKIPDTLLSLKESSVSIGEKIHNVSEKFLEMQLRLKNFESFLTQEKMRIFTIATSEHFPANDCAHIIKAFPSKRSGMYWIKNECMPKAQRVYCDFDSFENKGGLDYLIFNDDVPINTPIRYKFKNHEDLKFKCYELGMEPLEIKNEKMIKNIYHLLKLFKYDLNSEYIIPIAYDYNCEVSKCSKIYKSLNDVNSGDVSDFIQKLNEESGSTFSNLFSGVSNLSDNSFNIAAFGKTGHIVFEKLVSSKISAIICSTNKTGSKIKKNFIDIDCETNLKSEKFSSNEVFSILRVNCPSDCAKIKSAKVFGSDIYTDNSSICRAAVHAGAKKDDEESVVEIQFQPGRDKYLGVDRYNIASLDYADKWNRSFSIKKYNPVCPIESLKEYNPADSMEDGQEHNLSFMEVGVEENLNFGDELKNLTLSQDSMENKLELQELRHETNDLNNLSFNSNLNSILEEKLKEKELIIRLNKVISDYSSLVEQDRSLLSNKKHRNLVNQLGNIFRFLQSKSQSNSESENGDNLNINLKARDSILNKSNFRGKEKSKNKLKNLISTKNSIVSTTSNMNREKIGPGVLQKMRLLGLTSSIRTNSNTNFISRDNLSNINFINNNNNNAILHNNMFSALDLQKTLKTAQEKLLQQNEVEKLKNFLNFEPPKSHSTTEVALSYVSVQFASEKKQVSEVKKVSDEFKVIIGKTKIETDKLINDKNTGLISQEERLKEFKTKLEIIGKAIYEIDRKIQNKVKQIEFKVKEAKSKIIYFNNRQSFTEEYNLQDINENWFQYASKEGKDTAPTWGYYQYFLNGHYKVIEHKGNFRDNRSGAHLILKNKDYYDFELKCSFLLKDNNTFGIAFRYKDPFNYYIFEVSNQDKGVKRIRKYIGGLAHDIDTKNDGGFLQDTWYNVKIRGQQSVFHVYMSDYNGEDLESHYELQFKFTDNELVHGSVAFASNGMNYLLIDNINVNSLECTNFDDGGSGKVLAIPPTCSRFQETFRNGFDYRWKFIDPLESVDGPGFWKLNKDFADREIVLTQQSLISGASEYQEGTIALLSDVTKVCNHGRFIIKVKALDEGIIGLIFRFDNESETFNIGATSSNASLNSKTNNLNISNSNFYILEISGMPDDQFVRIRKKVKDKYTLVSSNPTIGYKKNTWFKIILTIENDHFNAFITENSSDDNLIKVFPNGAIDNDLKFGLLGVSTYKTKAIFDEIILSPFDNVDVHEDEESLLYVDEEQLDCKKFIKFNFLILQNLIFSIF